MADPTKARLARLTESLRTVLSGLPEGERREALDALYQDSGPILFSIRVTRSLNVFEVEAWEDAGRRTVTQSAKSLAKAIREINRIVLRWAADDAEAVRRRAEAAA